ncbi:MAG TPA: sigma-70 family RNA polymerase sigma factor [Planctomycetota bacterium]|jgi:RNA polymerase sigma factor (sigma-70 family)|nr:sigma-70 family RNA polymerase sigma factor [Planctomycetota bacterium]
MGEVPDSGDAGASLLDIGGATPAEAGRTLADLDAFRHGDEQAFEKIWRRFLPALEILIRGRIRSGLGPSLRARLDAETDDIIQEVSIRVLAKLPDFEYRGPGSLLAWMSKVAGFVVAERADYWRRDKRNPGLERPLPASGDSSVSDPSPGNPVLLRPSPGPSTAFDLAEKRKRLATALADLSERHHTIVLWRFFAGAEWSDIAKEIGAPSGDAVRMECYLKVFPVLAAALTKR